jgi:hypothetical protein
VRVAGILDGVSVPLGESGSFHAGSALVTHVHLAIGTLVEPKPIGPPNGEGFVGPGALIAVVDGGGFFAWCFLAKAADVDKPIIARLTMMILFMLELLETGTSSRSTVTHRFGSGGISEESYPLSQPIERLLRPISVLYTRIPSPIPRK